MDSVVTVGAGVRRILPPVEQIDGGGSPSILWKAFAILDTFRDDRPELSLSQISRRSGLPKSTVHRVIRMLIELGAVDRHGEEYRMGPVMFSYGIRSPQIALREAAAPHVRALAGITRQTVQVAVLRGRDVLYVDKFGGRPALSPAAVGERLGAHMTALGKAILAFSDDATVHAVLDGELERRTPATITDRTLLAAELLDVRGRHTAHDREEVLTGLRCVGAPVLARGRAVAAVSIAYPAGDGTGHVFLRALQETAARIAAALPQGELLTASAG